jgi:hypothetical protein
LLPASDVEIVVYEAPGDLRLRIAYPESILPVIEGWGLKGNPANGSHLIIGHEV